MINYDDVVSRLRQHCPFFNSNVYGSAEFEDVLEALAKGQATVKVPSAYVQPLGFEAGENSLLNTLQQEVTEAFMVTVYLDNSADRAGRTAASKFPIVSSQLCKSLLNWNPLPERTKNFLLSDGGIPIAANRKIASYRWTFKITYWLTTADGYDEENDPFTRIDITDPKHPNLGGIRVDLEQ